MHDVPGHWQVRRLRTVAEIRVSNVDKHTKEAELPVRLCNYVDVYKNDRITQQLPFMLATASADEVEKFRLHQNDILITKDSETWDDIGVPALVTEPAGDLISGYHLAILRPREDTYGPYLFWAIQSKPTAYQFHVEAKGVTRYGLAQHGINSALIPHPSLPEQKAIARFLDHTDDQIQRYIAAKQRLIALLEEQRRAVIHQSVTRGLDPNINLKPSALEWLGEVPEHWEVTTAKRKYIIQIGKMLQPSPKTEDDKEVQYLRALNIQWENLVTHDIATMWASSEEIAQLQVQPTDLLVCEGGAGAGNSTIVEDVPEGIIIQNSVHRVRARKASSNKFLLYILKTSVDLGWLEVLNNKATIPHFTKEKFETFPIALPPIWEQEAIIEHLNKSKQSIDEATDRARRQIELMQEYRTRLIADVVTGKLDVREAAEDLPQLEPTDITN